LEAPPEEEGLHGGSEGVPGGAADSQDLGMASLFRRCTLSKEDQEDTAFLDHLPLGDPDDEVGNLSEQALHLCRLGVLSQHVLH
jgi:hypothetical protein